MRHYPHLRISARGLGLSSTHLTRQLSGTHYAAVRLLRPSGPASAPRLPEPTRDRLGGCGRPEVSQVPTRSLTARTGLRLRWSGGPSQNGPAHVACGGSQRLGLHGKNLSKLNTVLVVSLCTLQDHRRRCSCNTRYQAGATPFPDRTSTGWIAPASPGAREQILRLSDLSFRPPRSDPPIPDSSSIRQTATPGSPGSGGGRPLSAAL